MGPKTSRRISSVVVADRRKRLGGKNGKEKRNRRTERQKIGDMKKKNQALAIHVQPRGELV